MLEKNDLSSANVFPSGKSLMQIKTGKGSDTEPYGKLQIYFAMKQPEHLKWHFIEVPLNISQNLWRLPSKSDVFDLNIKPLNQTLSNIFINIKE